MVVNMTENNGLALKIFSEFCCDGCSCKSEKDHAIDKDLGGVKPSSVFRVEDEHTFVQPQ